MKQKGYWSAGRLATSIISIILSVVVTMQSCAVGVGNALMENNETSGSSGAGCAFMMLVAGIVGCCARKSKGGSIATAIFYFLGGIIALSNVGSYKDLAIWGVLCLIFGVVNLFAGFKTKKIVEA